MFGFDLSQPLMFLQVAVGIGFLILIHELGHFLCAKWAGVRVDVFSIGFGKRLFGFRRGDTDYRFALIPLGGYVKVAGEMSSEASGTSGELVSKSFTQRALFFSGGVIMNLLFALIASRSSSRWGVPFTSTRVGDVAPGSPAWEAAIEPGDRVLAVDGKPMYSFDNLVTELALADRKGATLLLDGPNGRRTVLVHPQYGRTEGFQSVGIGPALAPEMRIQVDEPDGPAGAAGLVTGDILVSIDGAPITGTPGLAKYREAVLRGDGKPSEVVVRREGTTITASVAPRVKPGPPRLGVEPPTNTVRGLRASVPIVKASGLRKGDRIVAVQGAPLFRADDLKKLLPESGTTRLSVASPGEEGPREVTFAPAGPEDRTAFLENVALGIGDRLDTTAVPAPVVTSAPSPAETAGLAPGDRIVKIDDRAVTSWSTLVETMNARRKAKDPNAPIQVTVQRRGDPERTEVLTITPVSPPLNDLGFVPIVEDDLEIYQVPGFLPAVGAGFTASVDLIKQLYVTLKKITTGDVSATNLGGIITISRASYQFAKSGWVKFLYFLGLLSINLAFINVLPIPVLDGGHLLFLLIEKVKGSPVSERVFGYSQMIGMIFILALMIFVTFNDIQRLFRG